MAKAEVTAPAMHTTLQCRKGILKGQFQRVFEEMKMLKARSLLRPCTLSCMAKNGF